MWALLRCVGACPCRHVLQCAERLAVVSLQIVLPKVIPPPPDQLWGDSGTYLPGALESHASIAYVMNQEKGRLRIRDLKAAIEDKKADAMRVEAGLNRVAESSGDVDALDDEAVEAAVKVCTLHGFLEKTMAFWQVGQSLLESNLYALRGAWSTAFAVLRRVLVKGKLSLHVLVSLRSERYTLSALLAM